MFHSKKTYWRSFIILLEYFRFYFEEYLLHVVMDSYGLVKFNDGVYYFTKKSNIKTTSKGGHVVKWGSAWYEAKLLHVGSRKLCQMLCVSIKMKLPRVGMYILFFLITFRNCTISSPSRYINGLITIFHGNDLSNTTKFLGYIVSCHHPGVIL